VDTVGELKERLGTEVEPRRAELSSGWTVKGQRSRAAAAKALSLSDGECVALDCCGVESMQV
jgi:hypothetical protein